MIHSTRPFVFVALFIVLISPVTISAHGTYGSVDKQTGVLVSASYDDDEPMTYTDVTITRDGDAFPYQTGRTDKYGYFMFFPQDQGRYQAMVQDDMGHGVTLVIETDDQGHVSAASAHSAPVLGKGQGLFVGLGVIFFLSGLGFWVSGKRRLKG